MEKSPVRVSRGCCDLPGSLGLTGLRNSMEKRSGKNGLRSQEEDQGAEDTRGWSPARMGKLMARGAQQGPRGSEGLRAKHLPPSPFEANSELKEITPGTWHTEVSVAQGGVCGTGSLTT